MLNKLSGYLTIALLTSVCANSQTVDVKSIKENLSFLASDKLKGRGTSSLEELIAANYISSKFKSAGLTSFNGSYLKTFTYKKNLNPHDTSVINVPEQKANNVIGFLNNKAPYTIVIGAHYDHLGLGHDKNSLDANPENKIHNGADDNASGTAGVIELASFFSKNNTVEPYNFLFVCFSGEELGLLGSKKYCENPDIDLTKINYMINMDMIGRLNDSTKKLLIYGVGTSPSWVPLIDSLKTTFIIKKDSAGIGPSDQTSFYLKDIPVLHFFTGQHEDYHKPSDDIDKINFKGEVDVLVYITKIIEKTYNYPKLAFSKTKNPDIGRKGYKITMGVMPDYTYDGAGMRIDGVTEAKPAAKAGLIKGDVIKKLGKSEIKNIQDYMKALSEFKKGDATTVDVLRNGEIKNFNLTF